MVEISTYPIELSQKVQECFNIAHHLKLNKEYSKALQEIKKIIAMKDIENKEVMKGYLEILQINIDYLNDEDTIRKWRELSKPSDGLRAKGYQINFCLEAALNALYYAQKVMRWMIWKNRLQEFRLWSLSIIALFRKASGFFLEIAKIYHELDPYSPPKSTLTLSSGHLRISFCNLVNFANALLPQNKLIPDIVDAVFPLNNNVSLDGGPNENFTIPDINLIINDYRAELQNILEFKSKLLEEVLNYPNTKIEARVSQEMESINSVVEVLNIR